MIKQLTLILSLVGVFTCSCSSSDNSDDSPAQSFPEVIIGAQRWTLENLDVSTYRNGDPIPQVQGATAWNALTTGAWCYYENNTANGSVYGKLYNWYAVTDSRGLAPRGYHVPSVAEWNSLTTFLGGYEVAGAKMKTTTWLALWSGIFSTNSSGFTGLPAGYRTDSGIFEAISSSGSWWSTKEEPESAAYHLDLSRSSNAALWIGSNKKYGSSVRCIRD